MSENTSRLGLTGKNKRFLLWFFLLIAASIFFASATIIHSDSTSNPGSTGNTFPSPIDPQRVRDQDWMTWADYRPIPGYDWSDPSLKPEKGFRLAVVAVDFPD